MRRIDGLLLDVDGVLTVSWRAIPGATDALRALRAAAIPFVLVTNTTTHSRERLAAALGATGIEVGADEILTASAATARFVRARYPGASVHLVAAGDAREEFAGMDLVDSGGDVVVIGGVTEDEGFDYESLNRAFGTVMAGAPLVAMHRNHWWMTASGPRLDAAVVLPGFEESTGVAATVVGKPSAEFFAEGLSVLGLTAEATAMVGDDIETDVRAAQAVGMAGILVRTGKFREEDLRGPGNAPDSVVRSIVEVPEVIGIGGRAGG